MHFIYVLLILSIIATTSIFYDLKEDVVFAKGVSDQIPLTNSTSSEIKNDETEVLLEVASKNETNISTSEETSEIKPNEQPIIETVASDTIEKLEQPQKSPVPFYSQFADITSPSRKKIGCGVASLAMLIELYNPGQRISVDDLFEDGLRAGAYLDDAGWIHAGLINLSHEYGLDGQSHDMANKTTNDAYNKLQSVLQDGPVIVSVHYTFEPTNPIPHLVVINSISENGETVYYNDPAETAGNNSISKEKFIKAWKKRYIEIRPLS